MAQQKLTADKLASAKPVLQSVVKRDMAQINAYVSSLNDLLKSPEAVALRICECCVHVVISRPGEADPLKK